MKREEVFGVVRLGGHVWTLTCVLDAVEREARAREARESLAIQVGLEWIELRQTFSSIFETLKKTGFILHFKLIKYN